MWSTRTCLSECLAHRCINCEVRGTRGDRSEQPAVRRSNGGCDGQIFQMRRWRRWALGMSWSSGRDITDIGKWQYFPSMDHQCQRSLMGFLKKNVGKDSKLERSFLLRAHSAMKGKGSGAGLLYWMEKDMALDKPGTEATKPLHNITQAKERVRQAKERVRPAECPAQCTRGASPSVTVCVLWSSVTACESDTCCRAECLIQGKERILPLSFTTYPHWPVLKTLGSPPTCGRGTEWLSLFEVNWGLDLPLSVRKQVTTIASGLQNEWNRISPEREKTCGDGRRKCPKWEITKTTNQHNQQLVQVCVQPTVIRELIHEIYIWSEIFRTR